MNTGSRVQCAENPGFRQTSYEEYPERNLSVRQDNPKPCEYGLQDCSVFAESNLRLMLVKVCESANEPL